VGRLAVICFLFICFYDGHCFKPSNIIKSKNNKFIQYWFDESPDALTSATLFTWK
jgi:hypothetical protein